MLKNNHFVNLSACRRQENGISLIVVMLMLVIIGITSAAAIRNASSTEHSTNSIRLQNMAQQYAQAALRYCETQLTMTSGKRQPTLTDAQIAAVSGTPVLPISSASSAWNSSTSWFGRNKAATFTTVDPDFIQSTSKADIVVSVVPPTLPVCMVERQSLADLSEVTVITARGFSSDYSENPNDGSTDNGSVVWLQSIVH